MSENVIEWTKALLSPPFLSVPSDPRKKNISNDGPCLRNSGVGDVMRNLGSNRGGVQVRMMMMMKTSKRPYKNEFYKTSPGGIVNSFEKRMLGFWGSLPLTRQHLRDHAHTDDLFGAPSCYPCWQSRFFRCLNDQLGNHSIPIGRFRFFCQHFGYKRIHKL